MLSLILGVTLVLLVVFLIWFITITVRRENKYRKIITTQKEYMVNISNTVVDSFFFLKKLDINGVFESDDEVGYFFKQMKAIQEQLNQYILQEEQLVYEETENK